MYKKGYFLISIFGKRWMWRCGRMNFQWKWPNWSFLLLTANQKHDDSCWQINYVHIFNEFTSEAYSTFDLWYNYNQNEELVTTVEKKSNIHSNVDSSLLLHFKPIFFSSVCSVVKNSNNDMNLFIIFYEQLMHINQIILSTIACHFSCWFFLNIHIYSLKYYHCLEFRSIKIKAFNKLK